MKRGLSWFLTMAVLCLFQQGALGAEPGKIAVVDVQKFQNNSEVYKKKREALNKKFTALQAKLQAEKDALMKLEEEYRKQSMMLSLDAQEDKKREVEKKRRYYGYLREDLTAQLKDMQVEWTKNILKELEKIVEKIAMKEGYLLILEKRTLGLIYYDRAIDITKEVTTAYDQANR